MTFQEAQIMLDDEIGYDYIIEAHQSPDFYDFIVSIGGDAIKYRVYKDGSIYAK